MFKRICTEGVAIEEIARLVGHATTCTTEIVYRRELRPFVTTGALRRNLTPHHPQSR